MGFIKPVILGILAAAAARFLFYAVFLSDFSKVAHKHEPGKCVHVAGIIHGAEDLQLLEDGIVIITTGLNWLRTDTPYRQNIRGKLMVVDLNAATKSGKPPVAKELVFPAKFEASTFNPHGLSAWPVRAEKPSSNTPDTKQAPPKLYHLYVVNHRLNATNDFIEVFEFDVVTQTITRHVRSISGPGIKHVNNLVAVGKEKFYFTNDFSSPKDFLRKLEFYAILPSGTVGYYDGQNATLLVHTLMLPNGIAISRDYKHLYVVESLRKTINIYYISTPADATPTLRWVATHDIGSIGDNIHVDADGDLWIGAHPVGWRLMMAMASPEHGRSPSQVLRLALTQSGTVSSTTEIFADDGSNLSASTAALYFDKHLLIGTINERALWCECVLEQCSMKSGSGSSDGVGKKKLVAGGGAGAEENMP